MTETEETFVPQSILSQGEAAEAAIRQRNEPLETAEPEPDGNTPKDAQHQTQDVDIDPKLTDNKQEPAGKTPEKPTGDVDYEAKYKTLKGKYDAEVPRLWGQVNTLQQENQDLVLKVKELENKSQQAADTPDEDLADFDPEDFADLGPDFVKLMKTNLALKKEVDALKNQLGDVSRNINTSQQATREQAFYAAMSEIDGWETQNNDPEFIGWLQTSEPLTGVTYLQLLQDAYKNLDGKRAATVFLKFREESGKSYAQGAQAPNRIKQPTVAPPKSRSGGSPANVASQGKIFTRAEVGQFYKDVSAGKYSDADAKAIEQDIFQAKREGRIR